MESRPVLALDFDGTIRRPKDPDHTIVQGVDDIELFPEIESRIWEWVEKGGLVESEFVVIGITNQTGIAFGYKTAEQVNKEIHTTLSLFEKNPFQLVFHASMHEDGDDPALGKRSFMRKPEIGMLGAAEMMIISQLNIAPDWDSSYIIGDRKSDKLLAKNGEIDFIWADDFRSMGMNEAISKSKKTRYSPGNPPWRQRHQKLALDEGWGIFKLEKDKYQLQKHDEAGILESDDEAWRHVVSEAKRGVPLHMKALKFLEEHSPKEFKTIMATVE